MNVDSHALDVDFPQHKDRINQLRKSNDKFRSMSDTYHELDDRIRSLEKNDIPTTDQEFSRLKMERAHLKDELYGMLQGS